MRWDIEHATPAQGLPEAFIEIGRLAVVDEQEAIPADEESLLGKFSAESPWFKAGHRARAFWIAGRARLVVFLPRQLVLEGSPAAFFGLWESVPGQVQEAEANRALFEHAMGWARRQGVATCYGPVDFSTYGRYRLRLSAERGAITFQGEPWNPPRYPALLRSCGFEVCQGYVTQIADSATLAPACARRRPMLEQVRAAGYTLTPMTHEGWLRRLPELHGLIDEMFGDNFAYTPLSLEDFSKACGPDFIRKADPQYSTMCLAPDGALVGFFLVVPHYGALLRMGAGDERVSAGELTFATHAPLLGPNPAAVLKTVGVHPAHRRRGLMDAMVLSVMLRGQDRYRQWVGALIRDDNPSGRFGQGTEARRYGLYRASW